MSIRTFLSSLIGKLFINERPSSSSKIRSSIIPTLEILEDRTVPAVYTWKAGAAGNWNVAANWQSTVAGFPDDAGDTAVFDGVVSNSNVTINNPRIIGRLDIKNNYTGEIKLTQDLTIKNSAATPQGVSLLDSDFKIAPQNATSDLIIDSAVMYIRRGTLGSTANTSNLTVINNGELYFKMDVSVHVGMNLVVGTVAGGNGKGDIIVQEMQNGYNNIHLKLDNDVGITINKDSDLNLKGEDGDGSILAVQDPTKFVTVVGSLLRDGEDDVSLQLPVLVKANGSLFVQGNGTVATSLYIANDGVVGTNAASLYVEDNGNVFLMGSGYRSLKVSDEIIFDGGALFVKTQYADLDANSLVEFKNDAQLFQLSNNTLGSGFSTLIIYLWGQDAKVKLTSGTWNFGIKPGGATYQADTIHIQGGDLEISQTNTKLDVKEYGNFQKDDIVDIISIDSGTITGDFATKVFTTDAGWSTEIVSFGDVIYRLTALKNGGMGVEEEEIPPPP